MCWNCQGIGSDLIVRRLREFQTKNSPDIMFLMETKRQDEDVFWMYRGTDFSNHFTVPPVGLSGGLALSWKDNVHVEILAASANVIDTEITHNDKSFFVSYIYGVPQREHRAKFWEELSTIGAQRKEAWLLTEDFNDLLDNTEKVGGPLRWEGSLSRSGTLWRKMAFGISSSRVTPCRGEVPDTPISFSLGWIELW